VLASLLAGLGLHRSSYKDERMRSAYFRDGRFHNDKEMTTNLWSFLKMRRNTPWAVWPDWVEADRGPAPPARVEGREIRVTLINHSTVLIQTAGYNIITDPIYSDRAGPFSRIGPRRVRSPGIRFDDLPKIDAMMVSHDHYDHLDLPTIRRLVRRDDPRICLGLGAGRRLDSMDKVTELDWWERTEVGDDFFVSFTPVQHFSGRTLADRFSTLWGGFVLEISDRKIYFAGDSGYADHYKQTFERFGPMDLSLLPIGAYSPRGFMGFVHIDPKQAVQAHLDLQSRQSLAMHFGTFQQSAEPIEEPIELLVKERELAGLKEEEFAVREFGQPLAIR
jgi:L-ascorbate metabolism protein UlaG (beta-lactamase superfamily)